MILTRRVLNSVIVAAAIAAFTSFVPASANTAVPFSANAFKAAQMAGDPILVEIIRALWLKAGPVINLDLRANPQRLAKGDAIRFHADVREAITAGNGAAARQGIATDISSAADFILSRGGLAG